MSLTLAAAVRPTTANTECFTARVFAGFFVGAYRVGDMG